VVTFYPGELSEIKRGKDLGGPDLKMQDDGSLLSPLLIYGQDGASRRFNSLPPNSVDAGLRRYKTRTARLTAVGKTIQTTSVPNLGLPRFAFLRSCRFVAPPASFAFRSDKRTPVLYRHARSRRRYRQKSNGRRRQTIPRRQASPSL